MITVSVHLFVHNTASHVDIGGMDLYVRQFGLKTHDQFYTNPSVLNAFMNFTTQIVSRYVNSSAIFSWELANDPRSYASTYISYVADPL